MMTTFASETLLTVENLSMDYDDGNGKLSVLEGLSFAVAGGEFLCLVGPSGYGKTTLVSEWIWSRKYGVRSRN